MQPLQIVKRVPRVHIKHFSQQIAHNALTEQQLKIQVLPILLNVQLIAAH